MARCNEYLHAKLFGQNYICTMQHTAVSSAWKVEAQNGECAAERGGTGDRKAGVIVVREGFGGQENVSLLSRAGRVVCSSLEFAQTQPPNTLPSCMAPWF